MRQFKENGGYTWQWIAPYPVNHYALKMMMQAGLEPALIFLFDGYLNDDDRLWKLELTP